MREVTLDIERNHLPFANLEHNTILKVVTCRHLDKGMMLFVEVIGQSRIHDILAKITNHPNVVDATFKTFDEHRASGIIRIRDSLLCRSLSRVGGFCKSCPLELGSASDAKVKWKVVFENNSLLDSFLAELSENGVNTITTDAGDLRENGLLTLREEQSIRLAQELGYFQFPRKTSLREVSAQLGISASTLDEILRRAEYKIIKGHIRKPNGANSRPIEKRSEPQDIFGQ